MDVTSWWTFLLVFVRITTFMVSAPLFSGRQIPTPYKIGFSAVLSFLVFGLVKEPFDSLALGTLVLLILKEFLVGIVLGMVANIFFYSVQVAGTLIDMQIGFSMASFFDPSIGTTTQLTGRMKNVIAILVLLSTNGHHLLLKGIMSSFDWVPLQAFVPSWMDGRISTFLLQCVVQMFLIGFMMAAPIIGTMFVVDFALGIIARTVPQMNFFAIAPPIKLIIHFMIYLVILPSFFYLLNILFETMFDSMDSILKIMGA